MFAASNAGLLLSACTKFAGDMAALVLGLDVPLMAIQLERILYSRVLQFSHRCFAFGTIKAQGLPVDCNALRGAIELFEASLWSYSEIGAALVIQKVFLGVRTKRALARELWEKRMERDVGKGRGNKRVIYLANQQSSGW